MKLPFNCFITIRVVPVSCGTWKSKRVVFSSIDRRPNFACYPGLVPKSADCYHVVSLRRTNWREAKLNNDKGQQLKWPSHTEIQAVIPIRETLPLLYVLSIALFFLRSCKKRDTNKNIADVYVFSSHNGATVIGGYICFGCCFKMKIFLQGLKSTRLPKHTYSQCNSQGNIASHRETPVWIASTRPWLDPHF